MTREEIKNTPELVDFMLDECILADSRTKLVKRLKEVCDLALKALEQQTCEDAVSRQAVLDIFAKNADAIRSYSVAWEKISDLPSVNPQPKWIPVSERLPEDIRPVIVTWKNTDPKSYYQYIVGKHFIGTAHYKNGKWFWYSNVMEDLLAEYGRCDCEEFDEAIDVIAWMPLPEPYKAESEG